MMAVCGLNCAECPCYKATLAADVAALEATAKEWSSGDSQYKAIDMLCLGCSSANKDVMFTWCEKCEVKACAFDRNVAQCGQCDEFATCPKIQGMLEKRNAKYKAIFSMMNEKACAARKQVAATKSCCQP